MSAAAVAPSAPRREGRLYPRAALHGRKGFSGMSVLAADHLRSSFENVSAVGNYFGILDVLGQVRGSSEGQRAEGGARSHGEEP